jgi:3',5'-cyclic AMP phosphodiesterase CpdA
MKIAHISDLHFGCISDAVRDALLQSLSDAAPDLVIASGDLTQSATVAEFQQAAAFFKILPAPWLSIPGNHDLPGMDIERFTDPFGRYERYIARDLDPEFASPLVHVKAINSARMIMPYWNWANGGVSARQCRETEAAFAASTSSWRVFVIHHPLVSAGDLPLDVKIMNRRGILKTLTEQRVDIVLAGHQHHAFTETLSVEGHTTIFLNASTATSLRLRQQPNGFNMLDFTDNSVRIDMLRFNGAAFETFSALTHTRDA